MDGLGDTGMASGTAGCSAGTGAVLPPAPAVARTRVRSPRCRSPERGCGSWHPWGPRLRPGLLPVLRALLPVPRCPLLPGDRVRVVDVTRPPPSVSSFTRALPAAPAAGAPRRRRRKGPGRGAQGCPGPDGVPCGAGGAQGVPGVCPCPVEEDAGGGAEEEPRPERRSQVSGSGIEVGAGQDGLCTSGTPGGLSLCPPCSAPPPWAVSPSEATPGPQLDPVPPHG